MGFSLICTDVQVAITGVDGHAITSLSLSLFLDLNDIDNYSHVNYMRFVRIMHDRFPD
ncbi:hypothetical protein Bresa_01753|uniref:Uncharacterized protein n=1 Tax=Brenneria salicis ATCC 15712 = DSM 30166 TaxID=714314 RepID=A0A366I4H1_9GAMM|nr:hypothetical protein [Brenneria salicis ATCC 15712 = DSM 30166]RBP63027.1 hypothetical protein DES54_11341 [Brenneria salicis ATCC 15712 = DSM 30166]